MAKKDTVWIDIRTEDGGTMQKVAVSAQKLGIALDDAGVAGQKMGKSAQTTNRRLKGLSQQSSNATKNNAKLMQSINSGLVPAYAVLASHIFAISAAFRFLKEAADMRVMQESQIAFTGATGVAMKSLTSDIQAASEGMLDFKAASEAAAIGIASGLGAGQIEELSEGAANLSKILGRDVTDSFNRLIRGVTKAEPELLDELGIILRLENAQNDYAIALNKTAKDLTTYEKKQAVFVDVQGQLEKKYAAVAKATGVQANKIARLGVAFDRVMKHVKGFTAAIGEPTAEFFTKNIGSLTVALGLLATNIFKQIIPGFTAWAASAQEDVIAANTALDTHIQKWKDLEMEQARITGTGDAAGAARGAVSHIKAKPGSGLDKLQKGEQLSSREVSGMLRFAEQGKGAVTQMSEAQKRTFIASLKVMKKEFKGFKTEIVTGWQSIQQTASIMIQKTQTGWGIAMAAMKKAASRFVQGVNFLFRAAGWVGMAMLLKDLGVQLAELLGIIKSSQGWDDLNQDMKTLTTNTKQLNKEYSTFNPTQLALGLTKITGIEAQANRILKLNDSLLEYNKMLQATSSLESARTHAGIEKWTAAQEEEMERFKESMESMLINVFGEDNKISQSLNTFLSKGIFSGIVQGAKEIFGDDIVSKLQEVEGTYWRAFEGLAANYKDLQNQKEEALNFEALYKTGQAFIKPMAETTRAGLSQAYDLLEYLNAFEEQVGASNLTEYQKEYKALVESIVESGKLDLDATQIKALEGINKFFDAQRGNAKELLDGIKNNTKAFTEQANSVSQFRTKVYDLIKTTEELIATNNAVGQAEGWKERDDLLQGQLAFLQKIRDVEIGSAVKLAQLERDATRRKIGKSSLEIAEIDRALAHAKAVERRLEADNRLRLAQEEKVKKEDEFIKKLEAERDELLWQEKSLERQLDLRMRMADAARESFATALSTNLADFIKGDESSLKDALIKTFKAAVDAAIDSMVEGWVTWGMGKLENRIGGQGGTQATVLTPKEVRIAAAGIRLGLKIEEGQSIKQHLEKGGGLEVFLRKGSIKLNLDPFTTPSHMKIWQEPLAKLIGKEVCACKAASAGGGAGEDETSALLNQVLSDLRNTLNDLKNEINAARTQELPTWGDEPPPNEGGIRIEGSSSTELGDMLERIVVSDQRDILDTNRIKEKIDGLIFIDQMSKTFDDHINGLEDTLKTASTDFEQIGKLFEEGVGSIMNIFKSFGGGSAGTDSAGGIMSLVQTGIKIFSFMSGGGFGFADGGIAKGGFKKYATGGIATGPQLGLIGEGKHNEAIVPLPDGKSIPVIMPKGSGTNNVGVTVNITNDRTERNTEGDTAAAERLGDQIADVVQQELLNQKRNGGILSPYGVA
tara:strand:+ start:4637 stop:8737 length:4101 start_codon:yes stop_codon:yes gene_type:complete